MALYLALGNGPSVVDCLDAEQLEAFERSLIAWRTSGVPSSL